MKKFTVGAIAGIATVAIAIPLLAQISSAASSSSSSSAAFRQRPVPSQACVQAMANVESAQIANTDAQAAARKSALQAHQTALVAAAAISDETQRKAALKAADDAEHAALEKLMPSDAVKTAQQNMRTACGMGAGMGFGNGMKEDASGGAAKGLRPMAGKRPPFMMHSGSSVSSAK